MAKYRKKPVVIEAVQFDITAPIKKWPRGVTARKVTDEEGCVYDGQPVIQTLEGELTVSDRDWIITGVKGERYPCKPDIFEATYELVKGGPA